MPKPTRPPAQLLSAIEEKATAVKAAVNALNERITQFEQYLSRLPGRVETIAYGHHPDAIGPQMECVMSLVLKLHRDGKSWILSYGTHREDIANEESGYSVDYKPLDEASVKIKMAAVQMFPDVLASIEKSQDQLILELKKISTEYDAFAKSLVAPRKATDGIPFDAAVVVKEMWQKGAK